MILLLEFSIKLLTPCIIIEDVHVNELLSWRSTLHFGLMHEAFFFFFCGREIEGKHGCLVSCLLYTAQCGRCYLEK